LYCYIRAYRYSEVNSHNIKILLSRGTKTNDHKCYLVMKFKIFEMCVSLLAGKIMKFWVHTCWSMVWEEKTLGIIHVRLATLGSSLLTLQCGSEKSVEKIIFSEMLLRIWFSMAMKFVLWTAVLTESILYPFQLGLIIICYCFTSFFSIVSKYSL
jgi:hypothetical protein